VRIVI